MNLDKIFRPNSAAVIGASTLVGSVGNTVLRNLIDSGFRGNIYPVNPKYEIVEERHCFDSVADLPEAVDLAVICTPAVAVAEVVQACGEAGIMGLVIITAGFREAGEAGRDLEDALAVVAESFPGMRIVGPNCLGILSPHRKLSASFASDMPAIGNVAFISQSGALCTSVLDWAITGKVGFSQFVSVGNMMDVTIADLIDYFADDGHTKAIILYIESLTDARVFMSAARAFSQTKPIIVYKAGRFAESAQAAASHTGAMAGVDAVYDAAFTRAGIVRVLEIEDLFDCAEYLARHPKTRGERLAIVTNAGGPGVMATDALLSLGGKLASLSEETIAALDTELPASWSRRNPVDVISDATPERFSAALAGVIRDEGVDAVLVILSPQAMTDPTGVARSVIEASKKTSKPILASWMGGRRIAEGDRLLTAAGIPTYSTPEKCVRVFMHLVQYHRNCETLSETPHEVSIQFEYNRESRCKRVADLSGLSLLTESESKSVLQAYGIPTTATEVACSKDDAVEIANRIGYPVVMKVCSRQITHKTDVQGVELNLQNADEVVAAYDVITNRAKRDRPAAIIEGVTVQPMLMEPLSRELIVGAKCDPVFGPVILVGAGGVTAELFQDYALELPPLNELLARRMLESLKMYPLLSGFRGRRGVNVEAVVEVLLRVSALVTECSQIAELDINPLVVTEEGAIAVDARMIVNDTKPSERYEHLAICPYPERLVRQYQLSDGQEVLLRPIRPEDEPMWKRMIEACSEETIAARFRYLFRSPTHAMATRFCFVDYDRELAIVVEIVVDGKRQIAGVGRLVADADHQQAEYAVLVVDRWQGKGIGSALTDFCLAIADQRGIQTVVAETAPQNHRMLEVFRHRGFEIDRMSDRDVVILRRSITQASNSSR